MSMRIMTIVLCILFSLVSCTDKVQNPKLVVTTSSNLDFTPSSALSSFYLEETLNNTYISTDIFGRFFGNYIYLNLPPGTNKTNLRPTFAVTDPNTKIYIENTRQMEGATSQDFSNPVLYILQSPNGKKSYFKAFLTYDVQWVLKIDEELLAQLSRKNLETHIKELSALPTRLNWTEGNARAADYIETIMSSYGYITKRQVFDHEKQKHENIICYYNPYDPQKNPVILSAHYDSINHERKFDKAPGADDNATGVAFLMETARLLANQQTNPILFVFFDSEEQGLWGSSYFVNSLFEMGVSPKLNFTVDMIGGFKTQPDDLVSIMEYQREEPASVNADSRALGSELMGYLYEYGGLFARREFLPVSDFVPFMDHGIPAIGIIEGSYRLNPNYHNDRDTFENINGDYFYKACRGALAFILYKTL